MRSLAWLGLLLFGGGTLTAAPGGAGHEYDGVKIGGDGPEGVPAALPARIAVDPSARTGVYSSRLFGCNYDWRGIDGLRVVTPSPEEGAGSMPLNPEYLRVLRGVPFPLNRMAGTDSQFLQWKKAIGPLAQRVRHKRISWDPGGIQLAGPVEWVKSVRELDPAAEFVWTLNMTLDTPADARDLAEFFTGGADTVWGRKRIACGLKEPVKPAIWELGNELDWGRDKIGIEEYVRRCRAVIAAIRSVQPDAVFAAHAATAPWAPSQKKNWKEWHRRVLAELAPELRFLSFHPYYRGLQPEYVLKFMDVMAEDIRGSANPGIRIFVSEHGKWPPGREKGEKAWAKNWYQTHALVGCLDTAEWQLLMLRRPEVGAMTYHAHCSGPWGMVYRDKTSGRLYRTGIAEMFRLFGMVPYGSPLVDCRVSGPFTDYRGSKFNFSAAAVASADGRRLWLLLNNRLPATARNTEFEFKSGSYRLVRQTTLSASDLHSYNRAEATEIVLSTVAPSGSAAATPFCRYPVPPKSLVLLELERR